MHVNLRNNLHSIVVVVVFYTENNVNRPNETSVVLTEGRSTTLSCSYDGSAYSLHWYRQKPGSKPEFLLLIVRSTKTVVSASPPHPHMSIRLSNSNGVDLEISSAAVSDSALYYCALELTVTEKQTTLYKNGFLFFAIQLDF
uniref:T-cell receptor alpha/delta variable 2.0.3 n=1 Tax=Sinocyclocheilus rhinocerous TaxID=307959 RepID=A0A673GVA9_9TELE